jgi:hypothetical protein
MIRTSETVLRSPRMQDLPPRFPGSIFSAIHEAIANRKSDRNRSSFGSQISQIRANANSHWRLFA